VDVGREDPGQKRVRRGKHWKIDRSRVGRPGGEKKNKPIARGRSLKKGRSKKKRSSMGGTMSMIRSGERRHLKGKPRKIQISNSMRLK